MDLIHRQVFARDRFAIYSDCEPIAKDAYRPIPIWEGLRNRDLIQSGDGRIAIRANAGPVFGDNDTQLQFSEMLPFAAREYQISSDPKDYFIVPVVIFTADTPNRNCVAFPRKELVKFQPEFGCMSFQTWRGKGVFSEHANKDITKAHGIIIDSFLKKTPGFGGGKGVWKVINLLAIDRTKYVERARQVLSGDVRTFSMGAYVGDYFCPITGLPIRQSPHFATRLGNDFLFEKVQGTNKLLFRNVSNVVGFETSIVDNPAFLMAQTDPDSHIHLS